MTEKKKQPDVAATVERHGRDMQRVNDKLRDLISTLQTHKERFNEAHHGPEGAPTLTPPPMAAVDAGAAAAQDRRRLEAELAMAREQLARATAERGLLRERLSELEAEHRRVCDEFVESEEQTGELVQLFATLKLIHASAGLEELLQTLQEVIINVVGSEELAIYERTDGALRLARSFGLDPAPAREVPLGRGIIGRVAETGRLWVAGREGPQDERLSCCVPLIAGGAVVGVIAVYRLLGHKPGLGEADLGLFELLTPHAGQALHLRRMAGRPA